MSDNTVLMMHAATAEILLESARVAMSALKSIADQFDSLRAVAADAAATSETEQCKREMLTLWYEFAGCLRSASDVAERGPMPSQEFRDEIKGMLLHGGANADFANERANNIAQAYTGRVLREPE